jgi:RNA-directed DNA polymerase
MNSERTARLTDLMEKVVNPDNWEASLRAVERNAGAPGPDGMKTSELRAHLAQHGEVLKRRLLEGSYQPGAARRKDIAKAGGGTRPLSIPDVQDRFVQQMLLGVLQLEFDPLFSQSSYGFRPGRSAHQAVQAAQAFAKEGHTWVVDMDITKFFDHVNHDILMQSIGQVVGDKRMLKLIGRYLRAQVVMPDGLKVSSEEGTPQGGPLSPLLANIYLDALDKELEKRGLRFVRYADDCNIYVKSEAAAQRVLSGLRGWMIRKLRLSLNEDKSGVGRPWERKFLGFVLTLALLIAVSTQSLERFENEVRKKWDAKQSLSSTELRDQWNRYVQGWWGYYRLAEERKAVYRKEGWIRRHIRKCFWQRWHSSPGRERMLRRLGVPEHRVPLGRSSRGAWAMAANGVMNMALNNRLLKRTQFKLPSDLKG